MTTSDVKVTPGVGRNVATNSITEDAETKQLQRIVQNDSSGNEIEAITVGQGTAAQSIPVVLASDDPVVAVAGTTAGVAVITDANGTLQQYLRGIVKLLITAGTVVLGAGTAAIGKLAANSGVTIGAVEVAAAQTLASVTTVGTVTNVVHVDDNAASLTVDNADLTAAAASLSVIDDWDETDRAKVNIIAGQAGVAANAGVVGATVPRVTVATDDGLHTKIGEVQASPTTNTILERLKVLHTDSANATAGEYETVAASQTTQTAGATGATGDYLEAVLIVPATVGCGAVSIKDGSNGAITIFVGGGTTPLADCAPIYVPLAMISVVGAWQITTGANVSAIAIGNFT